MKALIFNGALKTGPSSTSSRLTNYLKEQLNNEEIKSDIFQIEDAKIPLFHPSLLKEPPISVQRMDTLFRDADFHIWMAPLYHGNIPGVMKNCLDWLEVSANEPIPYLMGKIVGLICWANGVQAMQGINAMDAIARALRAWVAPYSIAIRREDLFDNNGDINIEQKNHFKTLLQLMTWRC